MNRKLVKIEFNFKLLMTPIINAPALRTIPLLNIDTLEKKFSNKLRNTTEYEVLLFRMNSKFNISDEIDAAPNRSNHA